ncbi:MAG TPA: hypothetical protein VGB97_02835 [Candidatus Paceibacterota bacterium]|jgi:hypothetical protein
MRPARRAAPVVRAPQSRTARPSSERLRDRRKRAQKSFRTALLIGVAVLAALLLYLLWLPQVRVSEVEASGPNAESVESVVQAELRGTYAYIVPRNTIFFLPKDAIRAAVLREHPELAAVSISRASFRTIEIAGTLRAKAFIWCGTTPDAAMQGSACYEADAEGLIYRQAEVSTSTAVLTTESDAAITPGDLRIYSPVDRELTPDVSPVGSHIVSATAIPDALRFVKAIRGLGVPVSALAIHDDEADLLSGPTRITYVLGREEDAAALAASVIPTLNLVDGTIEYLDLRFKGKAYVKKYGE